MASGDERRVYAALMVQEALGVPWDAAIRRWSRADDERPHTHPEDDAQTMGPCPKCGYEALPPEVDNSGGECPRCGHRPLGGMR